MKYLKYFETYTDEFLANAPSESVIRDWFVAEFEDSKDFDLENVTVTRREQKVKGQTTGILYYQYNILIRQDFTLAFDPIYNSGLFSESLNSVDKCKKVANITNTKILNKIAKKYNIIINNTSINLVSDYDVETRLGFYFQNIKTYDDAD
jgi:hypothetical protein